jgi:hypothetical protein
MRFAWLRENTPDAGAAQPGAANQLVFVAYNIAFWIPVVLGFAGIIDYGAAFVAFALVVLVRALANLYRNNLLAPERAEFFPLRAP